MNILYLCVLILSFAFASDSPAPTPETSPTTISVTESADTQYPLNPADKRKLLKEFEKALKNTEKARDHQERAAIRELTAAQSMRAREWRENEKKARRIYFEKFSSGPDRRKYVQDFVARKKQFDQSLKEEMRATRKSWKEKKDDLKASNKEKLSQFKLQLEKNERPDASLWPQGH